MIAVRYPLTDIANHVIQSEPIWTEGADRRRLPIVPLGAAAIAIGVVLADVVGCNRRCAHGQMQELPSSDQIYALTKLLNLKPSR
jgi:hypothetical protein